MEHSNRPASVAVVSWIWISSGIVTLVGGVAGIAGLSRLPEFMGNEDVPPQLPPVMAVMAGLSHYLLWLTLLQMVVAVLAIVAGIHYLRLRAWARGTLELLTWVSLAVMISLVFLWLPMWMMTSDRYLPADGSVDVERVKVVGAVLGAAVLLVAAVPLAMIIKSLRSKAVREAIKRAV